MENPCNVSDLEMHLERFLALAQVLAASMTRDSSAAGREIFVDENINALFIEMEELLALRNFSS